MSEESATKTMHCGNCGSEVYHIKFDADGEAWAECAECGRPTSAFGDGHERKKGWEREQ